MKTLAIASGRTRSGLLARIAAPLGGGALLAALLLLPARPGLAADATVAWEAVPNAGGSEIEGYTVHYGRSSGSYDALVDAGPATATTLTNLADGAVYYIAVSAYDQFGQVGPLSSEAVFAGGGADADGDGLTDAIELAGCTNPDDGDSDDDGILDGDEDANRNGRVEAGETDPCAIDTDADGIQDGTELGYTWGAVGTETAGGTFQPDLDPSTITDPLNPDTDGDGLADGREDANGNGILDAGETDPLVADPVLLFAEDFEDGGAAGDPDWTSISGVWSVTAQGAYVSASPFNNLAVVNDPALQAFGAGRIETRVRLPKRAPKAPNAYVVFQYRDAQTFRYAKISAGRITVGQVGEFPGEAAGVKATRKFKIRKNKWYRLRIDVDEAGTVAVSVVGSRTKKALTWDFPTAEPGAVGYQARKSASRFDDLSVWNALVLR